MPKTVLPLLAIIFMSLLPACAHADVLYKYREAPLDDGRYGPVANLQTAMVAALKACGKNVSPTIDGQFGPATRWALTLLSACPEIAPKIAGDAEAVAGTLTVAYWQALLPDVSPPSVDQRAHTIMLTYEATDYTVMEWNFCQSKPHYDPKHGQMRCYSNDPRSYLTWGPNGATAGGGQEVRLILQALDKLDANSIDDSFGTEAAAVRRMFVLRDRDPDRSLETYLCGVWMDAKRRVAWKIGFSKIGAIPAAREMFDKLYRSASLDGGKVASFYDAYASNHLVPTEMDYGFFKDRAAHTNVNSKDHLAIEQAIQNQLKGLPDSRPWQIRQAIALTVRPGSQRRDRLGRDVAFYVDEGEHRLNAEELDAWRARGRVWASSAGLSDDRMMPSFMPEPTIETDLSQPSSLTSAERRACPQAVLDTRKPN
ncbi:hypothetical protein HB780_02385 (plasmid) [Rhizobium lusitanum]|uniref:hypothetical protein n=1 Tax=Rhizobium lusitanum TaxID=293958 RepID=UPI00161EBF3A|nr:hypothetical protein [Rhizobium lusitanum]QND44653.1 hypothetical protein HB780_02385 [Rhizobium lusitanum]